MNRPLGLRSLRRWEGTKRPTNVIPMPNIGDRKNARVRFIDRPAVQTALRALFLLLAAIGATVLFFTAIALTSDEHRPALISEAGLRRLLATERVKAVKEADDTLAKTPQPEAGTLRGFFTAPKKRT